MEKYRNTLVMMGVSRPNALFFVDAMDNFSLTVSQEVKKSMIDTMLNTKVMDKTFSEWFKYFIEITSKNNVFYHFINENNQEVSQPYKLSDFDLNRIEKPTIIILFDLILQEYYKKNLFS